MKKLIVFGFTALSASFSASATAAATRSAAPDAAALMAGSARVEITPPQTALKPGDSIRDPLFVRAIVVGNGKDCAVLVGVDQGGVRDAVVKPAVDRASKASGCRPENFVISATHTHSGSTGGLGGAGEPNPKRLEDALVEAITEAKAAMRPARIGYGTGKVDLNVNRDLFVNNGWLQGPNPEGVSDKTLSVVEFLGPDNLPIGVYMNYAMHPIDFYLSGVISADFAGEASRYVERTYGPKTVAIFAQGASGDQNPRLIRPLQALIAQRTADPKAGDLQLTAPPPWAPTSQERNANARLSAAMKIPVPADRQDAYKAAIAASGEIVTAMGAILGENAIYTMRYGMPRLLDEASITGANRTLQCPGRDRQDRDDPVREGAAPPYADGVPVNIKVGMLRLGNIYIASVNGEVYNAISGRMKREAPVSQLMMTTLANGAANSGYIYSNEAGSHLTFQVIGSRLKPGCAEDAIVDAAINLIETTSK